MTDSPYICILIATNAAGRNTVLYVGLEEVQALLAEVRFRNELRGIGVSLVLYRAPVDTSRAKLMTKIDMR